MEDIDAVIAEYDEILAEYIEKLRTAREVLEWVVSLRTGGLIEGKCRAALAEINE